MTTKIKIPSGRGHRVACAVCGNAVEDYQIVQTPDGRYVCIAAKCHGHFDLAVYHALELRIWAGTDGPDDELHAPPMLMFLRACASDRAYAVETRLAVQRYAETMGSTWMARFGLPDVWRKLKPAPAEPAVTLTPRRRKMEHMTPSAPGAPGRAKRRLDGV